MPKLFEVTWTIYGSKTYRCQDVEAESKSHAKVIIGRMKLANGNQVQKYIEVKEIKEVA